MLDYEPVELDAYCNVDVTFHTGSSQPPRGRQSFHGLPFLIPDPADGGHCFVGFDAAHGWAPVTIPLGRPARTVLVAHALLESHLYEREGEPVGYRVADYVFCLADGTEVRVPIRERFEIAIVPTPWGQWPFLARPDQIDGLEPRFEGRWEDMGYRQAEAVQGEAKGYYLWAWHNPQPEQTVVSLRIEPHDRAFLVAAVTLGHLDEPPFMRTARRTVRISLPETGAAGASPSLADLSVSVDRGVASYPRALPAAGAAAFLADPLKGWGEARNQQATPAYVEVAATPSATLEVSAAGEPLGAARWGELVEQGMVETPRVRIELIDPGKNWVRVTVVDDATGRPVPCRVHFRSPEGVPYQPHGFHNHVNADLGTWHQDIGGDLRLGQITYAYIDGQCQGWLPRGEVIVDVARGYEYEPLRARVPIAPGQQELTLRLKRWTDMNARRWFSGDSHVHFLGGQGAHREAQAEDLNVVNLLQSQWGHLFTNSEDWTGGPTFSDGGRTIVYCSQENRQHMLGHLTLWGLKQPIMPWCSDGPSEAELGGALEVTLSHWADAAHAQGGTVIIPHLPTPNCEPAVLIATGRADAVEMLVHRRYEHLEYYRYLNAGYRLPLVGGTDKMGSEVAVGQYRTYAYIPPDEEFTYENWSRAVRAGRTFLSGGPMISFTVEGAAIGDTLTLPAGGGTVEVEATAESIFPLHTLEIVQEGRVVASTQEQAGARRLHLKTTLKLELHTWLAARCAGPEYTAVAHHDWWQRGIFAHTSPVYVAIGGEWWLYDQAAMQYMLTLIEGGLAHIRQQALSYAPGSVTHHHGEPDHQAYLERPFQEAAAAIHRRMHQLHIPHG